MPKKKLTPAAAAHKARKHHPFSPSKLQILEACPRFRGTEGTNEAAERGTLMHEASETLDFSKLTREEAGAVHAYLDFIAASKDALPGCVELTEIRVAIDPQETTAGFLDKVLISADETEAHVIDLKTGFGDIEDADNNLQGMAYSIGVRRKYPKLRKVKVSFYMPRQAKQESTHEFTSEELDAAYARIVMVVKRAKRAKFTKGFEMAVPHTGVCRFCAFFDGDNGTKPRCPKAGNLVTRATKHMPIEVPTLEEMTTSDDPIVLGKVMDFFKFLEEWQKPIKSRILSIARNGGEVNGYSVSCIPEREVVDEPKVVELVREELTVKLGLTPEQAENALSGCYTFSLSAAESVVSDAAPKGAKKQAKEELRDKFREAGAVQDSTPKVFLKRAAKFECPANLAFQSGFSSAAPLKDAPASEGAGGKMYLD